MTRRAKVTPDQVGLPSVGRRRVTGLRRQEVARLAGVSVEYYVQIERGHVTGVSEDAAHDATAHRRGTKRFHHPVVGDLALRFEALEITSAPGLTLIGYTAEAGSASHQALQPLAGWTASEQDATTPS